MTKQLEALYALHAEENTVELDMIASILTDCKHWEVILCAGIGHFSPVTREHLFSYEAVEACDACYVMKEDMSGFRWLDKRVAKNVVAAWNNSRRTGEEMDHQEMYADETAGM